MLACNNTLIFESVVLFKLAKNNKHGALRQSVDYSKSCYNNPTVSVVFLDIVIKVETNIKCFVICTCNRTFVISNRTKDLKLV